MISGIPGVDKINHTEYSELSLMARTILQDISHMTLLHVEQIDVRRMDYLGDQQT